MRASILLIRDIYAIETIYICVNLLDSSLSSSSYAKIKTRIGSESFATWRFFVSPDGGPNKHGTKMVVHPRVYAHGGSNSIESEQRIALMASRFGRKVRLMGSEQMTEGERERGYDKGFVSFLGCNGWFDRSGRFGWIRWLILREI